MIKDTLMSKHGPFDITATDYTRISVEGAEFE